jgi:hypothetical protein
LLLGLLLLLVPRRLLADLEEDRDGDLEEEPVDHNVVADEEEGGKRSSTAISKKQTGNAHAHPAVPTN